MKQRFLRLIALCCMIALMVGYLPVSLAASYPYKTTCMEEVNLRKRARSTSTLLKKIKAGETVTITGSTGDWYQVKYDGKTGYAMKKYVDGTDPGPDATPNPSLTKQAPPSIYTYPYDTTVLANVKLRKTAKDGAEVLVMIPAGSLVTVYARTDNGFAKVKYKGKTGYAVDTNLNMADIPAPTPVPTPTPKPGTEKYTELKNGSKGEAVKALQSVLAELGYMDEKAIDGKFGSTTETALKTFQKRNGFTQNGICTAEQQLLIYEGTPKDKRGYRQYVKTVAPVAGATIRKDSKGDAVSKLQKRLTELGYYTGEISGICDSATVDAIKLFEGRHGLTADGILNEADQSVLYGAAAMDAGAKATPTPAPTLKVPEETLRRGDKGEDVKSLQQRLMDLGYYTGSISGTFTAATEDALKAFQKKSSITADGVLGPVTRTVLYGQNAITAKATPIPNIVSEPVETSYPEITKDNVIVIRAGSMGEIVKRLQTRLQELGYYTSRLDGVYLTEDIEAVQAFQKANGLKVDGTAGYDTQVLLYSDKAISKPVTTPAVSASSLRYGDEGQQVTDLQNALIKLGYLSGSADGKFGQSTKKAVIAFQKANNLTSDGVAGTQTLATISSGSAASAATVTATAAANGTLKVGMVSDAVKDLQNRLIALGYLKGKADGKFGVQTSLALIAFQQANGLTADGVAGKLTLTKLSTVSAKQEAEKAAANTPPTVSYGSVTADMVQYSMWYSGLRNKCKQYPNATVYDFSTGISWQVNMFSLGAHADSEPLTAEDTEKMNKAFGGKTTWTPKPVWVVLSDGSVYMASTHNVPHEVQHIKTNNFEGHLCIHFPRTQEQVKAIGPYATSHQETIDLGWEATQRRAGK